MNDFYYGFSSFMKQFFFFAAQKNDNISNPFDQKVFKLYT